MPAPCRNELKSLITIQKQTQDRTAQGRATKTWSDFDQCWAKVNHAPYMSDGKLTEHGGKREFDKTVFTIPFIEGVKNTMRILLDGEVYEVVHVNNYMHQNEWLQITTINKGK